MRNRLRIGIFAFALGVLALVTGPALQHEYYLYRLGDRFDHLEHPANTRQVHEVRRVGLLVGNGNHCDYLVGDARAATESWEDVVSYYVLAQQRFELEFEVKEFRDGVPQRELVGFTLPHGFRGLEDWGVDDVPSGEWVYVVYVVVSGDAGYDPRCH